MAAQQFFLLQPKTPRSPKSIFPLIHLIFPVLKSPMKSAVRAVCWLVLIGCYKGTIKPPVSNNISLFTSIDLFTQRIHRTSF